MINRFNVFGKVKSFADEKEVKISDLASAFAEQLEANKGRYLVVPFRLKSGVLFDSKLKTRFHGAILTAKR